MNHLNIFPNYGKKYLFFMLQSNGKKWFSYVLVCV